MLMASGTDWSSPSAVNGVSASIVMMRCPASSACFARRVGQDGHELVTAVAPDDVRGAQSLAQLLADEAQRLVSLEMAVRVIEVLELVHVHHHHGEGRLVARRPRANSSSRRSKMWRWLKRPVTWSVIACSWSCSCSRAFSMTTAACLAIAASVSISSVGKWTCWRKAVDGHQTDGLVLDPQRIMDERLDLEGIEPPLRYERRRCRVLDDDRLIELCQRAVEPRASPASSRWTER